MINTRKIKFRMKAYGVTREELAKELKIAPCTLSQKLNNTRPLFLQEAETIAKKLKITDWEFGQFFFESTPMERGLILNPFRFTTDEMLLLNTYRKMTPYQRWRFIRRILEEEGGNVSNSNSDEVGNVLEKLVNQSFGEDDQALVGFDHAQKE